MIGAGRGGQRGFTLLEVLTALMILALALGAVIKGGTANATNAAYLRDKTFAHWVGLNVVAEYRLSAEWAEIGKRSGSVEMAGREWYWRAEVFETFDKEVRRLEVETRLDEDSTSLARTIAFLPRPIAGNGPLLVPAGQENGGLGGDDDNSLSGQNPDEDRGRE